MVHNEPKHAANSRIVVHNEAEDAARFQVFCA